MLAGVLAVFAGGLAAWAAAGGTLKVDTPGMVLELDVRGRTVAIPPLREVPIGSGAFETKGIKLHAQGVDNKNRPVIWRLDGIKPMGELAKIEVDGSETKVVQGGQPLVVKTPVGISTKSGKTLTVGLQIIGKAGEHYRTVVYEGRNRVPAPKVAFYAEDGRLLDTGTFEYG
jgi:hypothetical protein